MKVQGGILGLTVLRSISYKEWGGGGGGGGAMMWERHSCKLPGENYAMVAYTIHIADNVT